MTYYERNKEKVKASVKKYREEHREQWHAWSRDRYARTTEKYRQLTSAWRTANRDKVAEYQQRRRAKLRLAFVHTIDRLALYRRDRGVCGICGEDVLLLSFTVDHVMPLDLGGQHKYGNVQIAHGVCNSRKKNRVLHTEPGWVRYPDRMPPTSPEAACVTFSRLLALVSD